MPVIFLTSLPKKYPFVISGVYGIKRRVLIRLEKLEHETHKKRGRNPPTVVSGDFFQFPKKWWNTK